MSRTVALPSVNLRLDADEAQERLSTFYLTRKGAFVVEHVLRALHPRERARRVFTIAAPPGSGKSYLALFLGSLLANRSQAHGVLRQVARSNPGLPAKVRRVLEQHLKSGERVLPVFQVGELDDPATAYLGAVVATLAAETGIPSERLLADALAAVTGASRRRGKVVGRTIAALRGSPEYFEVLRALLIRGRESGVSGVAILHDEFNRTLARAQVLDRQSLDFLQDLAEFAVRLKEATLYLVLITHKGISQYAEELAPSAMRDWLKIEGRFQQISYQEDSNDIYFILAATIERTRVGRPDRLRNARWLRSANPSLELDVGAEVIERALGCWPLDPIAFLALPLLSNLLGQNERTAFTFLADRVADARGGPLGLSDLYDYFDPYVEGTGSEEARFQLWRRGRLALAEARDEREARVIRCLTLLSVLNHPRRLPGTIALVAHAADLPESATATILQSLCERNLALHRARTETYRIHYGSTIQVAERVRELEGGIDFSRCEDLINRELHLRPVQATRFNAQHAATRFFVRRLLLAPTLEEATPQKKLLRHGIGALAPSPEALEFIRSVLAGEVERGASGICFFYVGPAAAGRELWHAIDRDKQLNQRLLLVVPENFEPGVYDSAMRYAAAVELLADKKLFAADPKAREDVEFFAGEHYDRLRDELERLFAPANAAILGSARSLQAAATGTLPEVVSALLRERYKKAPVINCELIVRDALTPNIRNARKKVIRALLAGSRDELCGLDGHGPDVTIFRCLFSATGLYNEETRQWQSAPGLMDYRGRKNPGLDAVLARIDWHIAESDGKQTFEKLYAELTAEPYGMYREVIPLYLCARLAPLRNVEPCSLYEQGRYVREWNSDLFERLHAHPERFVLRVLKLSESEEELLAAVLDLFAEDGQAAEGRSLLRATLLLLQWYARLPESTRNTNALSPGARKLLAELPRASSPEVLIFDTLPGLVGKPFRKRLAQLRSEIDGQLPALYAAIRATTLRVLGRSAAAQDLAQELRAFAERMEREIAIVAERDESVRRLQERITLHSEESALLDGLALWFAGRHPGHWLPGDLAAYEKSLAGVLEALRTARHLDPQSRARAIAEDAATLDVHTRQTYLWPELQKMMEGDRMSRPYGRVEI